MMTTIHAIIAAGTAAVLIGSFSISAAVAAQAAETCKGRTATIVGTDGDDTIVGTEGDDVIVGLGGTDRSAPSAATTWFARAATQSLSTIWEDSWPKA